MRVSVRARHEVDLVTNPSVVGPGVAGVLV
jgi:hypothetical protein